MHMSTKFYLVEQWGVLYIQTLMQQIQAAYKWGTWEEGSFVQCGIEVVQHPDFSIELRQDKSLMSCPRSTCHAIAVGKLSAPLQMRRNASFLVFLDHCHGLQDKHVFFCC